MACAKERGTVVDTWEQRDFYTRHYIYQVETETHVYHMRVIISNPPPQNPPKCTAMGILCHCGKNERS